MRIGLFIVSAVLLLLVPVSGEAADKNLCFNGTFDFEGNPLEGWITDYRQVGNSWYMENHHKVQSVEREGTKRDVAKLSMGGDAGAKMESRPIPFEQGSRYECTMDFKGDGICRVYFAGYKWKPGIRPHENPEIGELRPLYKSKANTAGGSAWKTITLDMPMKEISPLADKHLKPVRFITLYVYTTGTAFVDNVKISKIGRYTVQTKKK